MHDNSILLSVFLIFGGAALFATVALYLRQAMIVAYLVVGALLGPHGFGIVADPELVRDISNIGIMFLLFLLGLNLSPQKLLKLFQETTVVTLVCTVLFGTLAGGIGLLFGSDMPDALVIGICASFSSTIIGLKLLPTTVLHHRRSGEIIISILLLQDLIAIAAMLAMNGFGRGDLPMFEMIRLIVALPALGLVAWFAYRFVVFKLLIKFDRIQEYLFLLTIAWCLGLAQLAESMGLSYEIGAFAAGVIIATSPIAMYISESFKPIRDFFLVMFFFGLGAGFDLSIDADVILPALIIAATLMLVKPIVFSYLLANQTDRKNLSLEIGVRLGQLSEFSLLVVFVAWENQLITLQTYYIVQLATIITFIVSAFYIVARYPTPIALDDALRRD
ncbi:MAG: cation:proton antiporter [Gammaproteobacteria bacterium]|nr:cation:proton antiporter [Gammaproteobacteria bacterium]MYD76674.1 cation:proton antiporter [Gammaproteobacteria bacterium]MYJ52108.1 cation:proton antiporter [Gammaproteobacteria bacterium]